MIRLVKLSFNSGFEEEFIDIFHAVSAHIKMQEGCNSVKLVRDINNPSVFLTISDWESEKHLNMYRSTSLFKSTWGKIKPHFAYKAEAWSVEEITTKE